MRNGGASTAVNNVGDKAGRDRCAGLQVSVFMMGQRYSTPESVIVQCADFDCVSTVDGECVPVQSSSVNMLSVSSAQP